MSENSSLESLQMLIELTKNDERHFLLQTDDPNDQVKDMTEKD